MLLHTKFQLNQSILKKKRLEPRLQTRLQTHLPTLILDKQSEKVTYMYSCLATAKNCGEKIQIKFQCGSDGRNYQNDCLFKCAQEKCADKTRDVVITRKGQCEEP